MSKSRMQTLLALFVVGIGVLIAAIVGLFAYMSATAPSLHPDPKAVTAVTHSTPPPQWAGAVEQGRQIVRAGLSEQNLPGLSVAVGAGGDVVWAEGFGYADLEERRTVTPEMRFRTGGTSIALTSAAVGLLLEKGRLNLDQKIQSYVHEFPEKQWPVTLRQLMANVAGVRGDEGDEEPLSEHCERTVDGLARFAGNSLLFEPGTKYRYSPYGWILVSAAVEAAADEPFFSYMRTEIFDPLGMGHTVPDAAAEPVPDRVTFYYPKFAANTRYGPDPARSGDYSCFAGAGAFLSTPTDLARFAMAINSGKLLQPATVKMLQAPQRLASGTETGYGLGWDLETVKLAGQSTVSVGHDSEFTIGGTTSLMTFPERGLVVAVMTNTTFADASSLALKIAEAFAAQEGTPPRK